eukprot:gene2917-1899_t
MCSVFLILAIWVLTFLRDFWLLDGAKVLVTGCLTLLYAQVSYARVWVGTLYLGFTSGCVLVACNFITFRDMLVFPHGVVLVGWLVLMTTVLELHIYLFKYCKGVNRLFGQVLIWMYRNGGGFSAMFARENLFMVVLGRFDEVCCDTGLFYVGLNVTDKLLLQDGQYAFELASIGFLCVSLEPIIVEGFVVLVSYVLICDGLYPVHLHVFWAVDQSYGFGFGYCCFDRYRLLFCILNYGYLFQDCVRLCSDGFGGLLPVCYLDLRCYYGVEFTLRFVFVSVDVKACNSFYFDALQECVSEFGDYIGGPAAVVMIYVFLFLDYAAFKFGLAWVRLLLVRTFVKDWVDMLLVTGVFVGNVCLWFVTSILYNVGAGEFYTLDLIGFKEFVDCMLFKLLQYFIDLYIGVILLDSGLQVGLPAWLHSRFQS